MKRTTTYALVGLSLFLLSAGCRPGDSTVDPGSEPPFMPPAPLVPALRVAENDPAGLSQPEPKVFKVPRLQFLLVRLEAPRLSQGVTWVRLTLRSPVGVIYADQHVPFSPDPSVKTALAAGESEPAEARRPTALPGGYGFDLAIPVAGTEMQLRPIEGLWTLKASIDDQPDVSVERSVELGVTP